MASERIRQRAETALEYAKDFLQADEAEDDDLAEDDESESENGNKEDDHDGAEDEKAIEPKSDKDPKRKKPSKGIAKKVNKLVDVIMHPLGSKFNWKIDFNLGMKASNQKDQLVGNTGPNASTSGVPAQDDESLSSDAKRIKSLERDNKLLQKYASKFLDECIRLEEKVSILSKMEGELSTLKADNDRLKAELQDLQKLKQDLTSNLETQNEKQQKEVKRLEVELTTATESLKEMKFTNEKQMEGLRTISKEKLDLTKQLEQKKKTYHSELDNLKERLQQTEFKNTELTDQLQNLKYNLQTTAEQLNGAITQNIKLEQKNTETESENHQNHAQLDAANAKIIELRRAIQILESNPFTTTTAQMQREGTFSCPLCGASFGSLANMQLHAEDCNG